MAEQTVTVRALDVARVVALVLTSARDRSADEDAAAWRLAEAVEETAPAALEVLGLEALFKRSPDTTEEQ